MGRYRPSQLIHNIDKENPLNRGYKYTIYLVDPETGKKVQKTRQNRNWTQDDAFFDYLRIEKEGMSFFKNKKFEKELRAEELKNRQSRYYKLNSIFDLYIISIEANRKPSVIEKITTIYNAHIKDFFQNKALMNITQDDFNAWIIYLRNKRKKRSKIETLSAETRNAIISVFRGLYEFALKRRYTTSTLEIESEASGADELPDKVIWKEKDWYKFFSVIDNEDTFYQALFRTLFNTGMRISECRALHPYNIDFDEKNVLIKASIGRQSKKLKGQSWNQTQPKGKRARTVGLGDKTLYYLKKQIDDNIKNGYSHPKKSYIFGGDKPITINRVRRKMDYYIEKMLEIYPDMDPDATIHSIRHSVATYVATKQNIVFARDMLGHADLATTSRYVGKGLVPKQVAIDIENNFDEPSEK